MQLMGTACQRINLGSTLRGLIQGLMGTQSRCQTAILEKRYSSSSRAGGKVDEHRHGRRSQAVSANSKMVRRRDGSVGQEGADGSSLCVVMSTQGCDVVGQSLSPPATATATAPIATAPLDGLTIFPTYTPSTTAVSNSDTCQEHSTARAAQTTTTFNTTPPTVCPVDLARGAEEGRESGRTDRGTVCGVSGTDSIAMGAAAPEDRGAAHTVKARERF